MVGIASQKKQCLFNRKQNEKHNYHLPGRCAKGASFIPRQKRGPKPELLYCEPVATTKGEEMKPANFAIILFICTALYFGAHIIAGIK
jgi:hypothetical protein